MRRLKKVKRPEIYLGPDTKLPMIKNHNGIFNDVITNKIISNSKQAMISANIISSSSFCRNAIQVTDTYLGAGELS